MNRDAVTIGESSSRRLRLSLLSVLESVGGHEIIGTHPGKPLPGAYPMLQQKSLIEEERGTQQCEGGSGVDIHAQEAAQDQCSETLLPSPATWPAQRCGRRQGVSIAHVEGDACN